MKILVIGGAGFIGTNLIKRLLKDGHEVVSIDNYSTGKKENHQKGCLYNNFDISDDYVPYGRLYWPNSIKVMDEVGYPNVIFHLAALPRIQPSFKTPTESFKANVLGTMNILEWARKNGNIPIVYAGSSSTHGDKYANPYTFTKWQGEKLCKMYSYIYEVPTAICRFYNVYGPHQLTEGEYCTLIGIFETLYKEGKPLTITGDGEQRRDFTHVEDIVDGLMRVSEHNTFMGQEFEFGRGKNYSVWDIAEAFGKGHRIKYIDGRPGEMRETLCTDTTAHDLLDWEPTKDVIDFIKENYSLMK